MNIALATAQSLLSANNDKSLDLDDFYAWYLSGGSVPLRDLTIHALQFVSNTATAAGTASTVSTMKRSKSRTALDLSSLYSDVEVSAFAAQCESLLRLSAGDSLSYLLDLVGLSVKGRSVISHEMYTKVFYVYFLHQEYQLSERDVDILQVLDSIFAMLSTDTGCEKEGEQEKRVHILDLGSLLCTMSSAKYLQALKTLFDLHPDSHTGLVNSSILTSHLCQVLRLIFHFNPGIPEHTGCCPQDLACALSTKVLQVSEARHRSRHKLSFEEFVEAFLHGLMLGLSMLQIDRGYFCDYLERLMTYVGDSPMRSGAHGGGGGRAGEGESSSGEDAEIDESLHDRRHSSSRSSSGSSSGSSEYESDVDTEAATARLTVSAEDDTLDGLGSWEDQDHS